MGQRAEENRIKLPIPHADLSPNARVHWGKKSRQVKSHRSSAFWIAKSEIKKGVKFKSYRFEFTFKDKIRRDRDNFSARCKSYLDGIADAVGQNDSEWDFNGVKFNEPDKFNPHVMIIFEVE